MGIERQRGEKRQQKCEERRSRAGPFDNSILRRMERRGTLEIVLLSKTWHCDESRLARFAISGPVSIKRKPYLFLFLSIFSYFNQCSNLYRIHPTRLYEVVTNAANK
ncbi:uncharacterized protein K489DRAFT_75711 [Dissoconium aciculare CBS 342.82]|uniref:Uncharacterized protein n=1 Tax=Dissoconium aciculare CBS 342.82 TaxID=1314786 RepID=A0A6J3LV59_9PEZI|nr:uncharacterized protein K489DRAFT_75711 [Dissoconium aciculare CBS 342.82]KAF1819159.1 hypothetical protein K489DRAFT_75711 [Dissoconium aciculare CBS 342.82]